VGKRTEGRLNYREKYPDVKFGDGVRIYGNAVIGKGTYVGDYSVIGTPSMDDKDDKEMVGEVKIGRNVYIGPFATVHSWARLADNVSIDERCAIGSESIVGRKSRLVYGAQVHWKVKIGRNCIIGGFCCDRSIIEDNVSMFGTLVHRYMNPKSYKLKSPEKLWKQKGGTEPAPKIGSYSIIGFHALVIGGIRVDRDHIYMQAHVLPKMSENHGMLWLEMNTV